MLRRHYAGDRVRIVFLRGGKETQTEIVLRSFPEETAPGLRFQYTSFLSRDARLRAVVVSPSDSEGKKLPALLMVSALNSPRLVTTPNYDMFRDLARTVAMKGFRVLRFELRGYGDSEGQDYRMMNFSSEIEDNLTALDYLEGRSDVDSDRVFVYGHSTGGMVAAVIANRRKTAGVIVSCTIGRTFYERMVETLRRQAELSGDTPLDIDIKVKDYLDLSLSISHGESLPDIFNRSPRLRKLVNQSGRIMDDRTAEYWREQLNLNLPEIYSGIKEPVFIVYGKSDFLTRLSCHKHIRDVLNISGNKDVTLSVLPGIDHRYSYAKNEKESFKNHKAGIFKKNPAAEERIVKWLILHSHR